MTTTEARPLTLSPEELARLREIVRCVHCGAVPTEQRDPVTGAVIMREVNDQRGNPILLPYITTPHADGCLGVTKMGRPPRNRAPMPHERRMPAVPSDPCRVCGKKLISAPNRVRVTCSSTCRSRLKVLREKGLMPETSKGAVCQHCSTPMEAGKFGSRKYCSTACSSRASRARKAMGR